MKDHLVRLPAAPNNAMDCFDRWDYAWPGLAAGTVPVEERRIGLQWMQAYVGRFAGMDILELGPNEGEVTYALETFGPRSITSIECRAVNFFKCITIKNHYRLNRSTFLLGDFVEYLEKTDHRFDLIVAMGVLYHMSDPLRLLAAMSKKTKHLILDTLVYDRPKLEAAAAGGHATWLLPSDNERRVSVEGYTGSYYRHEYRDAPEDHKFGVGGADLSANFMTADDILSALNHYGFRIWKDWTQDDDNGPHLWAAATLNPYCGMRQKSMHFLRCNARSLRARIRNTRTS
jgi:hypothetical protein